MPTKLTTGRIRDLMADPRRLQALLLALGSDALLPIVSGSLAFWDHETSPVVRFRLSGASSSNPPTLRLVIQEAYKRYLAPLSWDRANTIGQAVTLLHDQVSPSMLPVSFKVPFIKDEDGYRKIGFLNLQGCTTVRVVGIEYLTDSDLDEVNGSLLNTVFLFQQGHDDHSDGYDC